MSIRVYLKPSLFPEMKGTLKHRQFAVNYPDGLPYVQINLSILETKELPGGLEGDVEFVTVQESFGSTALAGRRTSGEYRFRTATAVVEQYSDGSHTVRLRAQKVSDISLLYHRIRAGTICPDVPFNEAQVPTPARHLRQLLQEAWAIVRRDVHAAFESRTQVR